MNNFLGILRQLGVSLFERTYVFDNPNLDRTVHEHMLTGAAPRKHEVLVVDKSRLFAAERRPPFVVEPDLV